MECIDFNMIDEIIEVTKNAFEESKNIKNIRLFRRKENEEYSYNWW